MSIIDALLSFYLGILIGTLFQIIFICWAGDKFDVYIRLPFHIIGAAISWIACLCTTSFYVSWNIKDTNYYIVFEEIM